MSDFFVDPFTVSYLLFSADKWLGTSLSLSCQCLFGNWRLAKGTRVFLFEPLRDAAVVIHMSYVAWKGYNLVIFDIVFETNGALLV